jgi:hypothetical protein
MSEPPRPNAKWADLHAAKRALQAERDRLDEQYRDSIARGYCSSAYLDFIDRAKIQCQRELEMLPDLDIPDGILKAPGTTTTDHDAPADPLNETLELISRSPLASNMIRHLFKKLGRKDTLRGVSQAVYKTQDKRRLELTSLLIRRTGDTLDHRNAPLQISYSKETQTARLTDRNAT